MVANVWFIYHLNSDKWLTHTSLRTYTGLDTGMSEFTTDTMKNEVGWDIVRRFVEESNISPLLRPRLPSRDEPACQASWKGKLPFI